MVRGPVGRWTGAAALDAAVLVVLWASVRGLPAELAAPHRWVDEVGTDTAALRLAEAGLWVVAAWTGAALVATAAAARSGHTGRIGAAVSRRMLPAAVRAALAGSVGLSVLAAPLAAGAAPEPARVNTVSAVSALSTAFTVPEAVAPAVRAARQVAPAGLPAGKPIPVPWPHQPVDQPAAGSAAASPDPADDHVVVQPGDSLWLIAAHRLGPAASDREIATEWPRWYQANLAVVGDDPGVINPGQLLRAPESEGMSS